MRTIQTSYKPHDPRLSTIAMVERAIKESDELLGKTELWRKLPRKIMYPTFKEILEYLEASNKIIYDKNDKIVWVAVDNAKLEAFFKKTVKLR
ncbi:MAG: hypothetical protein JRN52_01610 [Nitrososphaerota archaeon]|nr:hypothetical protein [Nitrososphaerota archaeon]